MRVKVFIQNEAGSAQKHYVGTTSPDDCNVDRFVLTQRRLNSGQVVECEPLGLMEQIEDGQEDHNVLAKFEDEDTSVSITVQAELTEFVSHVFDHIEGKQIRVGRFLGPQEAEAHVTTHLDKA
jgi:inorganic pyrophosphatase